MVSKPHSKGCVNDINEGEEALHREGLVVVCLAEHPVCVRQPGNGG